MAIVAAVDRSDRSASVVAEAANLARAYGDTVHVVHVLSRSEFMNLGRASARSSNSVGMAEVREAAPEIAERHAGDLDVPVEAVGLMGTPADRIVDYAEEHDARFIVVGPRRRSPAGKAMFGSVAQDVLLSAEVPVVASVSR